MDILDKLTIKLDCKNFNKAIRAINRATKALNRLNKALNRLNKASNKCSEAFKNLKENIPMEIELEQGEKR